MFKKNIVPDPREMNRMMRKFAQSAELKQKSEHKKNIGLEPGDIMGVSRSLYDHYGVCVGKNSVIHYTKDKDNNNQGIIRETTISEFMGESETYFILVFPDQYGEPEKSTFSFDSLSSTIGGNFSRGLLNTLLKKFKEFNYTLYSPTETIERAKSRLGETEYNLPFNNCEHFSIWCKTGVSESHQVNKMMRLLTENNSLLHIR